MNLHIIEKPSGDKTLLPDCVKTTDKIIACVKMEIEEAISIMQNDNKQSLIDNLLKKGDVN